MLSFDLNEEIIGNLGSHGKIKSSHDVLRDKKLSTKTVLEVPPEDFDSLQSYKEMKESKPSTLNPENLELKATIDDQSKVTPIREVSKETANLSKSELLAQYEKLKSELMAFGKGSDDHGRSNTQTELKKKSYIQEQREKYLRQSKAIGDKKVRQEKVKFTLSNYFAQLNSSSVDFRETCTI